MKPLMVVGLILVILGVLAFGYQGVAYFTTLETVAQAGPFTVQADREHAWPLWPFVSGACMLGGVILMAVSAASTRSRV
jgi:hypothetical protein